MCPLRIFEHWTERWTERWTGLSAPSYGKWTTHPWMSDSSPNSRIRLGKKVLLTRCIEALQARLKDEEANTSKQKCTGPQDRHITCIGSARRA